MAARCPACSTLMSRRKVASVEYDGCPGCGGLWLDQGELQTLAKQPEQLRAAAANYKPGMQPSVAPERSGKCPRCEAPLAQFEFDTFRGIRLDRCRQCGGIWMDHGEAEQLAERVAPSAPPPLAPSAAPAAYAVGIALHLLPDGGPQYSPGPSSFAAPKADPADETSTFGLPVVRGIALAEVDQSSGLGGSFSRGWAFAKAAYGLALECPKLLVPMAVAGGVQLVIGMAALRALRTQMLASGVDFTLPFKAQAQVAEAWFQTHGLLVIGVVLLGFLLVILGNGVITGMTVNLVDAWLKGREPKLSVAAKDVLKNLGALIVMAVVTVVVHMLTAENRKGSRVVNAAKRAARKAWEVVAALLVPVIIIEDLGFSGALARARAIHSGNLLQIAVGEIGLRSVAALPGLAIAAIMGLAFWGTMPPSPSSITNIIVIGMLLGTPLNILNSFAYSAYNTCLYLWAAETERVRDPRCVKVPGLLASALTGTRG